MKVEKGEDKEMPSKGEKNTVVKTTVEQKHSGLKSTSQIWGNNK